MCSSTSGHRVWESLLLCNLDKMEVLPKYSMNWILLPLEKTVSPSYQVLLKKVRYLVLKLTLICWPSSAKLIYKVTHPWKARYLSLNSSCFVMTLARGSKDCNFNLKNLGGRIVLEICKVNLHEFNSEFMVSLYNFPFQSLFLFHNL